MSDETVALHLDLISAKAKILANALRGNGLWEGDLSKGISEIREALRAIENDPKVQNDGRR